MFIYVPDLSEFHADTPLGVSELPPHTSNVAVRHVSLAELDARANPSASKAGAAPRWQLVLPLARISFIDALLPPVSAQKRQALVQFAIEDKLTVDPASIHAVILGPADSGSNRFVIAAIERAWLTRVLQWLARANIHPVAAYAESAFETCAPREWVVRWNEAVAYACRPDGLSYLLETDSAVSAAGQLLAPPFALTLALNEVKVAEDTNVVPTAIHVYTTGNARIDIAAWQQEIGSVGLIEGKDGKAGTGSAYSVPNATPRANMNLLVGAFTPVRNASSWRALRPATALATLVIALQLVFVSVDAWRLASERRELRTQMENLFRQSFPEATTIVDPALQMRRNVAALKRERGIVTDESQQLLARATALLQLTPGANERITSIDLRGGELRLRLEGVPEPMRAALRASAGSATIEDTAQPDGMLIRLGTSLRTTARNESASQRS
jgi:type II secretion system protein L